MLAAFLIWALPLRSVTDMVDFMERMGSAVCHQMAERSFILEGMQMPLCARCTGIYIGVFFAFFFFFLKKRLQAGKPFSMQQAVLTSLAIVPIGVDGVGSYLGFWESSQLMRILTGSLVGAIVPGFLLMAGNFDPQIDNEERIYHHTKELLFLILLSVVFGLLLWAEFPLYRLGSVISVAGEVVLWGGVVWLFLKTICKGKSLWVISIFISFIVLFAVGGLVS